MAKRTKNFKGIVPGTMGTLGSVPPPWTAPKASGLVDGGKRESTSTGSLREPQDPRRGRYDLIPFECLYDALSGALTSPPSLELHAARCVHSRMFVIIATALLDSDPEGREHAILKLAEHYAAGAMKYADRNWEKGQDTGRCINSMFHHIRKLEQGRGDEDHRSAALWNCFTIMWEIPRLQDGRLPIELDSFGLVLK